MGESEKLSREISWVLHQENDKFIKNNVEFLYNRTNKNYPFIIKF
jgi:hypothetical protein